MNDNDKNKQIMNIISLTLGIISIVTAAFWYITLPAGILAIILGAISAKKTGTKIGKAGLITGIVGLALFSFMYSGFLLIIIVANL